MSEFYALDLRYDVRDFLTTDGALAAALDHGGRPTEEKLLINEMPGAADVCLYLDERLVARLCADDPTARLHAANLADFWTAFEGVSHFVYYAWNAGFDKPVTLLEMELQAEVDKFVATTLLLEQQGAPPSPAVHHWLFDVPRLDPRLDPGERDRYRQANRYAANYCRRFGEMLGATVPGSAARTELCRFYRLPQRSKLTHIERH